MNCDPDNPFLCTSSYSSYYLHLLFLDLHQQVVSGVRCFEQLKQRRIAVNDRNQPDSPVRKVSSFKSDRARCKSRRTFAVQLIETLCVLHRYERIQVHRQNVRS